MTTRPPKWIKPQLTRLVDKAPTGKEWLHEIKYDGYRMHARLDGAQIKLLTRTGLDWSNRYRRTIEALRSLPAKTAYIDGELCALRPDGVPEFSRLQAAMDEDCTDDADSGEAATREPVRLTPSAIPSALGASGGGRRSHLPDVDR
jgi:ATP-dependent DNA ligase